MWVEQEFDPYLTPARVYPTEDRSYDFFNNPDYDRQMIRALGDLLVKTPKDVAEINNLADMVDRAAQGDLASQFKAAQIPSLPFSGENVGAKPSLSALDSSLVDPEDEGIANAVLNTPMSQEIINGDEEFTFNEDERRVRKEAYQALNAINVALALKSLEQAQLNEAMASAASIVESVHSSFGNIQESLDSLLSLSNPSADDISNAIDESIGNLSSASRRITSTEDDLVNTRGKRAPSSGASSFHSQSGQTTGGASVPPEARTTPPNPRETGDTIQNSREAITDAASIINIHRESAIRTIENIESNPNISTPSSVGINSQIDRSRVAARAPSTNNNVGGNTSPSVMRIEDEFAGITIPSSTANSRIPNDIREATTNIPRRINRVVNDLSGGNVSVLGGNGSILDGNISIPNPADRITEIVSPGTNSIANRVSGVGNRIRRLETDIKNTIVDASPLGALGEAQSVVGSVEGAVDGVVDMGKKFCLDLGFLGEWMDWLKGLLGDALGFVMGMLGKLFDFLKKVTGFLFKLLGNLLKWLGNMWDWLKDLLGFSFSFGITCET